MDKRLLVNAIHAYYISLSDSWAKKRMQLSEASYTIFLSLLEVYIQAGYVYTDQEDLAKWFERNGWQVTEKYPHEWEITHKR